MSFSGFAEAYFEFCYHNCPVFNNWLKKWKKGRNVAMPITYSKTSITIITLIFLIGEKFPEFTRKHVSDMYYSAELESEIRHTNHPERIEWKFQRDEDRECYLAMLLSEQRDKTYLHKPSNGCKERGGYCMDCIIICMHACGA